MNRNRWIAGSIVVVLVGSSMTAASTTQGRGGQPPTPNAPLVVVENRFDRPVPVRVVNALDRPDQQIPIRVEAIALPIVKLDPETTVALEKGTVVKIAPPQWEYRELRVAASGGTTPSVVSALSAAGADGWETTGLMFSTPGATVLVLKRMR